MFLADITKSLVMIKKIMSLIMFAIVTTINGQKIDDHILNFKKNIGQIKEAFNKDSTNAPATIKKNIIHIKQGLKELSTQEKPLHEFAQDRLNQIKSSANINTLIEKIKKNLDKIQRYVTDIRPDLTNSFNNAKAYFQKIENTVKKGLPKN